MKHLALALATLLSLSAPLAAFTVDILPPNLNFPEPAPASQSCIHPASLTLGCK
ncbi:MAG: hypothetical protein ACOH2M_02135 [Cypionkella sp.]|jgi:hypothetical protein